MKGAIKSFLEDNEEITMWKVIRKMGIGVRISQQLKDRVLKHIDDVLINNH